MSITSTALAAMVALTWRKPNENGHTYWHTLHAGTYEKPVAYLRQQDDGRWRAIVSDNGTHAPTQEKAKQWCEAQALRMIDEMLQPAPRKEKA